MSTLKKRSQAVERSCIPATLRIGVTGHRNLPDEKLVREAVRAILDRLGRWMDDTLKYSDHTFVVISALAPGSDQIVAEEVLGRASSAPRYPPYLEAVLPMPEDDYVATFPTPNSKADFIRLKNSARSTALLKKEKPTNKDERDAAYEDGGRYVANNCDVLIVVWDGKPATGRGGTAEIVIYADEIGQSYFWINSVTGEIVERWNQKWLIDSLKRLDEYNGQPLSDREIEKMVGERYGSFEKKAIKAGISTASLVQLKEDMLYKYARASLLSKRYRDRYRRTIWLVYLLAPIGVAVVAVQALLVPELRFLSIIESIAMFSILILLVLSRMDRWHNKWIDYRFLAERLRVAGALGVVGIRIEPFKYSSHYNLSHQSDYWVVKAFGWIWNTIPPSLAVPMNVGPVKKFLLNTWIKSQYEFYKDKSEENERTHRRMDIIGYGLFFVTLIAALLHIVLGEGQLSHEGIAPITMLTMAGILFPAFGASVAAIGFHREYKRNAERYSQMISPLYVIIKQIEMTEDKDRVLELLETANELMLKENQDWRVSILTQKLDV